MISFFFAMIAVVSSSGISSPSQDEDALMLLQTQAKTTMGSQETVGSAGVGEYSVTNTAITNFASWASQSGAQLVAADFDGDGKDDLALNGPVGWGTVPVAFSKGDGSFRVTNAPITNFASWASQAGVNLVAGDFDGDGLGDLAALGNSGWGTLPTAFGNGDGSFRVTNTRLANFPGWASQGGAQLVAGDFNGDGKTDIALNGPSGWGTLPVAFSSGDGSYQVTNKPITNFASWASQAGAQLVVADFNGDGKDDLALNGVAGWGTVPVAFSDGEGTFHVTNAPITNFASWASQSGVNLVAGDFDGDGKGDLAACGNSGWGTLPTAFGNGDGSFTVTNKPLANFPKWSSQGGAQLVAGDINGDGSVDIALNGPSGWGTLPVAFAQPPLTPLPTPAPTPPATPSPTLPPTPAPTVSLDDLDDDELDNEQSDQENNVIECANWCDNKKKSSIPWEERCQWYACSTCSACS